MPSINMIAPRRAEKKRLESNVRKLLLVIVVEAAVVVSIFTLMATRVIGTQSSITNLDRQLTKLQPTVDKIEGYEKSTKELAPKLEILNQAKSDTLRWCRVLNALSVSLPDKTWLTRISTTITTDNSDITMSINGVSADQSLVGQTMLRLHDTVADFSSVDLHYTQQTLVGPTNAVEFEMAAGIKLPKKADSKEAEKS
ncbi:MAG: PilN domain-containing protein [Armatimonadota bacterium]